MKHVFNLLRNTAFGTIITWARDCCLHALDLVYQLGKPKKAEADWLLDFFTMLQADHDPAVPFWDVVAGILADLRDPPKRLQAVVEGLGEAPSKSVAVNDVKQAINLVAALAPDELKHEYAWQRARLVMLDEELWDVPLFAPEAGEGFCAETETEEVVAGEENQHVGEVDGAGEPSGDALP